MWYEQLNRAALQDAELYARTGRVRTPSPPPSSDSDGIDTEPQAERSDETNRICERSIHNRVDPLQRGLEVLPPQEYILVSSDTEDDICRCEKLSENCEVQEQCDKEEDLVSVIKSNTTVNTHTNFVRKQTETTKACTEAQHLPSKLQESGQRRMVTDVRNDILPEVRVAENNTAASTRRNTRGSTKEKQSAQLKRMTQVPDMPSGSGRRKKTVPKDVDRVIPTRGKRKEKTVSPAVVDVVFGKLQNSVANVEELRRKREEDTLKCGRVVRTIGNSVSSFITPTKLATASENHGAQKHSTPDVNSELPRPSLLGSAKGKSLEGDSQGAQVLTGFRAQLNDTEHALVLHGVDKQARSLHLDQEVQTPKVSQSTVSRVMVDGAANNDMEFDPSTEPFENEEHDPPRSPSPITYYSDDAAGRREGFRHVSPLQGPQSELHRSNVDIRRMPRNHPPKKIQRIQSVEPILNLDRSLRDQRERDDLENATDNEEDMLRRRLAKRIHRDFPKQGRENSVERLRHGNKDTSYGDRRFKHHKSSSPDRGPRHLRRSRSYDKSRSPTVSLSPSSEGGDIRKERGKRTGKTKDIAESDSPTDRRTRRYKFAVREGERSVRQKQGKKPFYLTVDAEGIPYGPGRPAWIGEVNKLAAWLDPSCTHIRKQTYEDMCILKDRLNDNFEYSGDLNQDYLRGLLGKAVTRKRTDLIAYIRKNGNQPVSFDDKIWKRLEKLASSEQRENRTKHGRYANGCRGTFGRTGALGLNGVRQKLEQLYGRSPDPDEVAEEMQRDKGYGKKDLEERRNLKRDRKKVPDVNMEEDSMPLQLHQSQVDKYKRNESQNDRKEEYRTSAVQENVRDRDPRESGQDRIGLPLVHSSNSSKEEYIAKLEAELRSLRGTDTMKASSSRAVLLYDSAGRRREDTDGGSVGYAAAKSTEGRNRRGGLN